jgi:hypothetical protein
MLPSGLPELVANDEQLARFLTSSSQFKGTIVKPSAFLPERKDLETSVFRHGSEPRDALWLIGQEHAAQGRNIHGAAIIKAQNVRAIHLEVIGNEPPQKHAAIRNWPLQDEPELQHARHKQLAILLARDAELLRK